MFCYYLYFPQGFIVFHALGGGTGSGLTKLFLDNLYEEFSQKTKLEVGIYPSSEVFTKNTGKYNLNKNCINFLNSKNYVFL